MKSTDASATTTFDKWIRVGRVVGVFGVHGELKVHVYSDVPERMSRLRRVFVGDERRPFDVEGTRAHTHSLLKLAGVDTPEAGKALTGSELWVPREEAVALPEGEVYSQDVIGIHVYTIEGEPLGEVRDLLATGSNDVYVVRGPRGEVLIPAIRDVVRELDVAGRRLVVEVIPGMLE